MSETERVSLVAMEHEPGRVPGARSVLRSRDATPAQAEDARRTLERELLLAPASRPAREPWEDRTDTSRGTRDPGQDPSGRPPQIRTRGRSR